MERTQQIDTAASEAPAPAQATVGTTLRQQREALGLSLKEIAATTRIQQSNLLALEEDRFEELPAEVFTRGFLRSFAREIELDENHVVDLYLTQTGGTRALVTAPTEPVAVVRRRQDEPADSPERFVAPDNTARVLYVAALAVMIIGLALAVLMISGGDSSAPSTATWQPADVEDNWRPAPAGHYDWQTVREN